MVALLLLLVLALIVGWAVTRRTPIALADAAPAGFDPAIVRRGAELAAVGNCSGCHTRGDGPSHAGGVALATPFGTIYGTNITPDPETGIGRWTAPAFVRAMREGVSRDGHLLYPAFPYDHFTRTTDADLQALYAFVMTRDPVREATPANRLRFPLGFRPLVAGWNLLFLDRRPWQADAAHDAVWNRGAYLVDSLGHCSGCHSPRNVLGAEDRGRAMSGGEAEGWYAPALNAESPSPLPWSVDQLDEYLRTGITRDHAIAGGPMQGVVSALSRAAPEDVRAIAVYIAGLMGPADTPERSARASASIRRAERGPLVAAVGSGSATSSASSSPNPSAAPGDEPKMALGAAVYQGACAGCHDAGRGLSSNSALRLPLAIAVHDPDPRSLIRIVRDGIAPPAGQPGRIMPAFGGALTDEQISALASWLRQQAAGAPPWPDLERRVKEAASAS